MMLNLSTNTCIVKRRDGLFSDKVRRTYPIFGNKTNLRRIFSLLVSC